MESCVTSLSRDEEPHHKWTGRDVRGEHFGRILPGCSPITMALYWKQDKRSKPFLVGRYRIDLACLCDKGAARRCDDGRVLLRFYRTDANEIAIGLNKNGPCLTLGANPLGQEAKQ